MPVHTVQLNERTYRLSTGGGVVTRAHASGHFYEQALLERIQSMGLRGIYIDVGAGTGNHTVFFARECLSFGVYAIEPNAACWSYLDLNVRANCCADAVHVIRSAVSDETRLLDIEARRGVPTIVKSGGVEAKPLDQLVAAMGVALIKIDVEGHEPYVLRGARRILATSRPVLAVEAQDAKALKRQHAVLDALDYQRAPQVFGATPLYLWHPTGGPARALTAARVLSGPLQ